jgi:hypothetical protein
MWSTLSSQYILIASLFLLTYMGPAADCYILNRFYQTKALTISNDLIQFNMVGKRRAENPNPDAAYEEKKEKKVT